MSTQTIKRPVLRWYGGKWLLAPWIIQHFPPHETYIEPFGGAASILIRKPRSKKEIYNDIDKRLVNLFFCLRDPELSKKLKFLLELTPFSREEYYNSSIPSDDPVESARRFVIQSLMGHATSGSEDRRPTSFVTRPGKLGRRITQEHDIWPIYTKELFRYTHRLKGVIVESKNAIDLIRKYDYEEALFYVDPPYLMDTRASSRDRYKHELEENTHVDLLDCLKEAKGIIILSGHRHDLYTSSLEGWSMTEKNSTVQNGTIRQETLFINPAALKRLPGDIVCSFQEIL